MTAADWIDDLERKAKAATPGPWYAHGPVFGPNPGAIGQTWGPNRRNDAKFIAAVNPATILRLIEELRATRVCYTDECGEPCRSHVAALWAERDAARKAAGVAGERLGKERAKVAEVQAERDRWKAAWEMASPLLAQRDALAARMPCDGGCNYGDGPMEDCSRHGRPPAEVWQIVTEVQAQRDALAARLAAVEALADETEQAGDPLLRLDRLRAALAAAPTNTTKEN